MSKRSRRRNNDNFEPQVVKRPYRRKKIHRKIRNFNFNPDEDDYLDPEDLFNFEKTDRGHGKC